MRTAGFLILMALLPTAAYGQARPPLPLRASAPLLYVRFTALPGLHVTFYQGHPQGEELPAPVVVGLRPGYLYRVKLSGLPDRPGTELFPTLEVRGTLSLPLNLAAAQYPASVVFSNDDIERILAGSMLTKVIYLENPEQAVPTATRADQPLEADIPPGRDPLDAARPLGRPMLIVRVGQRDVSNEELAAQSVPGTILLPRMGALPAPRIGPYLPWACVPLHDPRLGPRPPQEECLKDGGDVGTPAGLDREGRLRGLDPSDTVAEYADSQGRRHLAVSNRVCLCVPRFAVLRAEIPIAGYATVVEVGRAQAVQGHIQLDTRQPSRQALQNERLVAMQGRKRPSANLTEEGVVALGQVKVLKAEQIDIGPALFLGTAMIQRLTEIQRTRLLRQMELVRELSRPQGVSGVEQIQTTTVVGRVEGLQSVGAVAETRDLTVACNEKPQPPDKPLVLFKWADAQEAQVGDVVTFTLKYSNHGGQPITDVAVSDSLTGRLEYIPGSSQSDRNAIFTTQANEAGSAILRWEVTGRLLPGEHGIVRFQARVR